MEAITIQKFIHTSPRKLRLVADMVRKQTPLTAMKTLHFTQRAAAKELGGAISTALANANTGGLNIEQIAFKSIEVNEGPKMRRFRAGAKGRVKPYKRRMSHIKIVLSDELVVNSKKESSKEESRVEDLESKKEEVKVQKAKVKSTSKKSKVNQKKGEIK
jgi:large subunit ribosomal protein L22